MYEIITFFLCKQGTVTNKLEHRRTNWTPEQEFTADKSQWEIHIRGFFLSLKEIIMLDDF